MTTMYLSAAVVPRLELQLQLRHWPPNEKLTEDGHTCLQYLELYLCRGIIERRVYHNHVMRWEASVGAGGARGGAGAKPVLTVTSNNGSWEEEQKTTRGVFDFLGSRKSNYVTFEDCRRVSQTHCHKHVRHTVVFLTIRP